MSKGGGVASESKWGLRLQFSDLEPVGLLPCRLPCPAALSWGKSQATQGSFMQTNSGRAAAAAAASERPLSERRQPLPETTWARPHGGPGQRSR